MPSDAVTIALELRFIADTSRCFPFVSMASLASIQTRRVHFIDVPFHIAFKAFLTTVLTFRDVYVTARFALRFPS